MCTTNCRSLAGPGELRDPPLHIGVTNHTDLDGAPSGTHVDPPRRFERPKRRRFEMVSVTQTMLTQMVGCLPDYANDVATGFPTSHGDTAGAARAIENLVKESTAVGVDTRIAHLLSDVADTGMSGRDGGLGYAAIIKQFRATDRRSSQTQTDRSLSSP